MVPFSLSWGRLETCSCPPPTEIRRDLKSTRIAIPFVRGWTSKDSFSGDHAHMAVFWGVGLPTMNTCLRLLSFFIHHVSRRVPGPPMDLFSAKAHTNRG